MKTEIAKLKTGDIFYLSSKPKCQVQSTEMTVIRIPDYIETDSGFVVAHDSFSDNSHYAFKSNLIVFKK